MTFSLAGCGDDDSGNTLPDAAVDSGASGAGGGQGGSGGKSTIKPVKDAGEPNDSGTSIPPNKPVTFKVPANGGTTKVTLASGDELEFTFPKSAAGKQITLTPTSAASIGWPKDTFSDVIRMEPDGLKFQDPVVVKPSKGQMLLATFAESKERRAGEMLELATAKTGSKIEGLALHHFTLLGIIAAEFSCDDHNGWKATPKSQRCAGAGSATTYLDFVCDASPLCWTITGHCCATPGSTECRYFDPMATLSFAWQGPLDGTFPWCGPVVSMDAGHDAGQDASMMNDDDAGTGSGGTNGGGGSGGATGGSGGTTGGSGGTTGGSGGTTGGSGGTTGGSGGTTGGSGGTTGGSGGTTGGSGGTTGGSGGTGAIDASIPGVTCNQAGSWTLGTYLSGAEQLFGVWGASDTDVWVVGNATAAGALIGHYDGLNWTSQQPSGLATQGNAFYAVWGADATHVFAVGSGGAVYSNASGTWQPITGPSTSQDLYGVWGADANDYWVVGANGAAFQWTAGSWHDHSIADGANDNIGTLRGIWGAAPDDVWVVNETGVSSADDYVIHHFYSGSWHTDTSSNNSYYTRSIWGTTGSDIWAVGYSKGTSAHYAGSTWVGSNAPAANSYLNEVWGRATDSVWAVGDLAKIDYWDGMQWTACNPVTNFGLNGLYGTTTKVWAVGNNGVILRNDPLAVP